MAEMTPKITSDREALESIVAPRRILFIEDEDFIRELFTRFSKGYHCVLDSVGTGYEGLEKLGAEHYDTVFLDVKLPDIEGPELFRMAQVIKPDADFVVISGFLTNQVIEEIQSAGMAVFVVKPLGFRNGFLKKLFHTLGIEPLIPNGDPPAPVFVSQDG